MNDSNEFVKDFLYAGHKYRLAVSGHCLLMSRLQSHSIAVRINGAGNEYHFNLRLSPASETPIGCRNEVETPFMHIARRLLAAHPF